MIAPDIIDPATRTTVEIERPRPEDIAALAKLPVATLHEAAGKAGVLPSAIKPAVPGMRLCGPAVTVHSPGGDNLWLHRGIYIAQPGDVLVVSVNGVYDHGYWGEIMSTAAQVRGLAGLVIDGCVRDVELLAAIGLPVFARGLSIRGTSKDFGAGGWINAPIFLDGETVNAGDVIIGDADGVVCLPRARAAEVAAASLAREASEAAILERIRAGEDTLSIYGWR